MDFNEKLQELRHRRGLTQEELAAKLYVSRTAISKWESGRGYPNIDSLKAIAKFFSVTVDELLSTDEVLAIADEDSRCRKNGFRDTVYGLLDLSFLMLMLLPLFKQGSDGVIQSVSLFALSGVMPYLKAAYLAIVIATAALGALTLILQICRVPVRQKIKTAASLTLGALSVLFFTVSMQPYPAVFALALLAIKVITLIKQ